MNYSKLFSVLKKKNIKRTDLVSKGIISASTLNRLLHNKCVYMITLEILCAYLDCELSDICEVEK